MLRPASVTVGILCAVFALFTVGCTKPTYTTQQLASRTAPSVVVVHCRDRDGAVKGLGSGFVVSEDGLIATNLHVLGQSQPITVQLADGREYPVVEVHAYNRELDLALLRIDAEDLPPPLALGDSGTLEQGAPVVAMGCPMGLESSVVSGVVSGHREIDANRMIQLAIPIEPGNSGGPVVDIHGQVIGLVTMKSRVTRNLGFAVGIDDLKPLLNNPNPVQMSDWVTLGSLDTRQWKPTMGGQWRQQHGHITANAPGDGFGGRTLCIYQEPPPPGAYEVSVQMKLDNERGAAGLIFDSDGGASHYGFYSSNGNMRLARFHGSGVFAWRMLQSKPSPSYRSGGYNTLSVRVEQERVLCYLNDRLIFEQYGNFSSPGKPGLVAFRGTRPEFAQFYVRKTMDQHSSVVSTRRSRSEEGETPSKRQKLLSRAQEMERQADELRNAAARLLD